LSVKTGPRRRKARAKRADCRRAILENSDVEVNHFRYISPDLMSTDEVLMPQDTMISKYEIKKRGLRPTTHGGMTTATVLLKEPTEISVECSSFCSKKDAFSKRIGADIAVGRAIKEIQRLLEAGGPDGRDG
jgi:hypothetical protein